MKQLLIAVFFISIGVGAANNRTGYAPNSGEEAPGTFTSPGGVEDVRPKTTDAPPTYETDGVSSQEMNSSPNPTPNGESRKFDKTLSTGEVRKPTEVIQAEEAKEEDEEKVDYSTSPAAED